MFDLEQQIQSWRVSIADTLGDQPDLIDELESHLLEEVERLMSAGQCAQDAWKQAALRLGDPQVLADEFAKLGRHPWLPARVAAIGLALFSALLTAFVAKRLAIGKAGPLLALHVVSITIGYATVFTIGFVAIWTVLLHAVGGWTARQDVAFAAIGRRLAGLALIATAVGLVLGMKWSRAHLGHWWAWDAREIGALSVLAWSGLLWQCFSSRATNALAMKLIGIMGNIVVCISWFGPSLGGHSYGFSPIGMMAGAFLIIQFLAIYACFLPAGFLQLRRSSAEGRI